MPGCTTGTAGLRKRLRRSRQIFSSSSCLVEGFSTTGGRISCSISTTNTNSFNKSNAYTSSSKRHSFNIKKHSTSSSSSAAASKIFMNKCHTHEYYNNVASLLYKAAAIGGGICMLYNYQRSGCLEKKVENDDILEMNGIDEYLESQCNAAVDENDSNNDHCQNNDDKKKDDNDNDDKKKDNDDKKKDNDKRKEEEESDDSKDNDRKQQEENVKNSDDSPLSSTTILATSVHNNEMDNNNSNKQLLLQKQDISKKYRLGEIIGKGSFSEVVLGENKETNEKVAVKKVFKFETDRQGVLREIAIMNVLQRKHSAVEDDDSFKKTKYFPRLIEAYEGNHHWFLVCDYVIGGEIFERIINMGPYSEEEAIPIMRDLLEALEVMHTLNVVHGDIKPENLLLTHVQEYENDEEEEEEYRNNNNKNNKEKISDDASELSIKLCDFGSAILIDSDSTSPNTASKESTYDTGTWAYWSPEMLMKKSKFSQKESSWSDNTWTSPKTGGSFEGDMWASGCLLHILLTGQHPFDPSGEATGDQVRNRIVNGLSAIKERANYLNSHKDTDTFIENERDEEASALDEAALTWNGLSSMAQNLLESLLEVDPVKRITAFEALKHPWLNQQENKEKNNDDIVVHIEEEDNKDRKKEDDEISLELLKEEIQKIKSSVLFIQKKRK